MCVQSLDEMGAVFDDGNVYVLHMMYQAMGVCLYLGDWDGATHYGEKILKPYRSGEDTGGLKRETHWAVISSHYTKAGPCGKKCHRDNYGEFYTILSLNIRICLNK